jgi:biopolymer transport protein ExbD
MALTISVFFVLGAQLRADAPSVAVELPVSAAGDATAPVVLSLRVTAAGTVYLGTQILDDDTLATAVAGRDTVVLMVDRDCSHGRVMAISDRLRAAGVTQLRMGVQRPAVGSF